MGLKEIGPAILNQLFTKGIKNIDDLYKNNSKNIYII
jgi:hypothetical protein